MILWFADRPSPFFEFLREALHAIKTKEHGVACCCRSEEAHRWRWGGSGAPRGPCTPVHGFSMARGGLQWPDHAHAWRTEAQLWRRRYYDGRGDWKRAQDGRRELGKGVPQSAWSGGAQR